MDYGFVLLLLWAYLIMFLKAFIILLFGYLFIKEIFSGDEDDIQIED